MFRRSGGSRRRLAWVGLAILSAVLAVAAYAVLTDRPEDVSNPDVEFEATAPVEAPPTVVKPRKDARDPFDDGFEWPIYGYSKARTKYVPLNEPLRPPFVERWKVTGRILLEFPPVLCGRQVFLLKNNGALYGISRRTGKVRWKRKLGYLAASSPACGDGRVYNVLLEHAKGTRKGRVVAVNAADGRVRWSRKLPSRSESSPLLDHGRLYFGTENGTVFALRARDGALRWRYRAGGAVKGALALDRGRLFFGDYAGHLTALRRADGRRLWRAGSAGAGALRGNGRFYATPAVAFGRVYIGNTDGFVYSYSARNGRLAWRHRTGGYVYSSPAVSPILGGTVYAGSYDGKLYAFDARTGAVRWTRRSGGKISGGPTVVGDLVFYSNLSRKSTAAVGAATGKMVWSVGRGAFNPVIADSRRLYLVGYSSLFMLTEKGRGSDGRLTDAARDARSERIRKRTVARRVAERKRRVARRVARRRAAVRRILDARSAGREVCFRSDGRRVCRIPRPPVCFQQDGRTVCRARKPVACFEADGRKVCRARRE